MSSEISKTARHTGECGLAMYEFSLVLPVLLAIIALAVDISLYHYTRLATKHAVREAARRAETSTSFVVEDPRSYPALFASTLYEGLPDSIEIEGDSFISAFDEVPNTTDMYSVTLRVAGSYRSLFLGPLGLDRFQINAQQVALYVGRPPPNEEFRSGSESATLTSSNFCGGLLCANGMELWNERWGAKASLDIAKLIDVKEAVAIESKEQEAALTYEFKQLSPQQILLAP